MTTGKGAGGKGGKGGKGGEGDAGRDRGGFKASRHGAGKGDGESPAKRASASGNKAEQKRAAEERERAGRQHTSHEGSRFLRGQRIDPRPIDGRETTAELIERTSSLIFLVICWVLSLIMPRVVRSSKITVIRSWESSREMKMFSLLPCWNMVLNSASPSRRASPRA